MSASIFFPLCGLVNSSCLMILVYIVMLLRSLSFSSDFEVSLIDDYFLVIVIVGPLFAFAPPAPARHGLPLTSEA